VHVSVAFATIFRVPHFACWALINFLCSVSEHVYLRIRYITYTVELNTFSTRYMFTLYASNIKLNSIPQYTVLFPKLFVSIHSSGSPCVWFNLFIFFQCFNL